MKIDGHPGYGEDGNQNDVDYSPRGYQTSQMQNEDQSISKVKTQQLLINDKYINETLNSNDRLQENSVQIDEINVPQRDLIK